VLSNAEDAEISAVGKSQILSKHSTTFFDCVFYDLLIGRVDWKRLTDSYDIVAKSPQELYGAR